MRAAQLRHARLQLLLRELFCREALPALLLELLLGRPKHVLELAHHVPPLPRQPLELALHPADSRHILLELALPTGLLAHKGHRVAPADENLR